MSFTETALLGAIAGSTIYLGLPLGRIDHVDDRLRVGLAMFAVGILAFIFTDVTQHGLAILDTTLTDFKDHKTSFAHVLGLFAILAAGFTAGTAGISAIERRLRPQPVLPPSPEARPAPASAPSSSRPTTPMRPPPAVGRCRRA